MMLDKVVVNPTDPLPGVTAVADPVDSTYLRLHVYLRPVARPIVRLGEAQDSGSVSDRPRHGNDRQSKLSATLVRRCLGKALIDTLCPFGEPRCQPPPRRGAPPLAPEAACDLARSCAYGVCFAGSLSRRPPFALYVPRSWQRHVIELTLYGPSCRFYPWLLRGLNLALGRGMGKARVRWQIKQVWRVSSHGQEEKLCGSDLATATPALAADPLHLIEGDYVSPRPIELRLLSPTRLIRDGKLLRGRAPVPFEVLIARILDRFQGLYGDDTSQALAPATREALEAAAAQVPLVVDETRWVEVHDYSARQRAELRFGGKVGRLIYGEGAARFMPILRAGEILHVGKNPTSGCGRIGVRALDRRLRKRHLGSP